MSNEEQKIEMSARYIMPDHTEIEVDLKMLEITMTYGDHTDVIDADMALRRALQLVYENAILRQALEEVRPIVEGHNKSCIQVVGKDEMNRVVKDQMDDYHRKQDC